MSNKNREENVKFISGKVDLFQDMQDELAKINKYFVFYTHGWEQKNHQENILITPAIKQKGGKFDEEELVGLCLDMIMDFYEQCDIDPTKSKILLSMSQAVKRLYKEGFEGFKK